MFLKKQKLHIEFRVRSHRTASAFALKQEWVFCRSPCCISACVFVFQNTLNNWPLSSCVWLES